jgi:hypothetical protein
MAPPPTCSGFLRKTFTPPGSNTKRGIWPKRWLSLKQIAGGGLALVWSPSEGAPPTGHLTITKKSLGMVALALGVLYVGCGSFAHLMAPMLGDDPSPLLVGLTTPPVIMGAVAFVAACVASSSRSGAAGADLV